MLALLLGSSLVWGGLLASSGHIALGMMVAAAILGSFIGLLGVQFALLAVFGRERSGCAAQRPRARDLLAAWLREIRCTAAVFFWRQPFRSRSIPDRLRASEHRHGVVLVHGFMCNRGVWNDFMRRLGSHGIAFVAPSLEPFDGPIAGYAPQIEAAVRRIEQTTGRAAVIVAHSMGGLAVRQWLATQAGSNRTVRRIITIGTPHHGTWMARFGHTRNAVEMRPGSRLLRDLLASRPDADFTCFYSDCDNIVFPPSTARLEGALSIALPGRPHLDLMNHPAVFAETLRWTASGAEAAAG